jgi:putative ABC transport system permease protein
MRVSPARRDAPSSRSPSATLLALRIARRSVRRNLARSLLIAALVALPVAAATMVDVLVRSFGAPERDAQQAMGVADARLTISAASDLGPWMPGPWSGPDEVRDRKDRDPESVDLAKLLPAGTRLVRENRGGGEVTLRSGEWIARTSAAVIDMREPLLRHQAELVDGRRPTDPGDVLLSPALADRLHVGVGAAIAARGAPQLHVVGLAREPYCLSCERAVVNADSTLARVARPDPEAARFDRPTYLVDLPPGASADDLWPALAKQGVALTPRNAYLHPGRYQGGHDGFASVGDVRSAALAMLIAGLGLLEVVLLAGAAFAVGARRQTRELGLIAASGGSPRHVRRIVLAQGLVLGAIGAIGGVAVGIGIAIAGRPLWESLDNAELAVWAFSPLEIAGAALIGLVSGLAAAIVPAAGAARTRPVDALAERFRTSRRRRRRSAGLGAALIVVGGACGLAGNVLIANDFAAYAHELARVAEAGGYPSAPAPAVPVALIVGGATLLVAGIVILTPVLIGRLSGLGRRLPVAARLAVRDTARHRHRTGPATTAIAVAVAGSVVLAFVIAATFHADQLRHVPELPPHVLAFETGATDNVATVREAARKAAAALPGGSAHELRQLDTMELVRRGDDPSCANGCNLGGGPAVAAGDEALNAAAGGGAYDDTARRALAAGQIVVFNPALVRQDGRVALHRYGERGSRTVLLPAHLARRAVTYTAMPSALVPRSVQRERHWKLAAYRVLVDYDRRATPDQVAAAIDAADQRGVTAYDDSAPDPPANGVMLAIAGIAGFVTLVGVAISVALSAAEGRADLATLAAVGAAPRRRRALAASQALVIAGLGVVVGIAFGAFVAYTARATTGSPDFVVPWLNLAVTGLVVPLLAVLVATVFTPSRLPLVRRAT